MLKESQNSYKQAFYFWIRSRMKPLTVEEAEQKKLFWAKCYMAAGVTGFGYLMYNVYNRSSGSDGEIPLLLRSLKKMDKSESVRVVRFSNFQKVSDVTVKPYNMDDSSLKELLKAEPKGK